MPVSIPSSPWLSRPLDDHDLRQPRFRLARPFGKSEIRFIFVPALVKPLLFLLAVVLATAFMTGGFGFRAMGAERYGAKAISTSSPLSPLSSPLPAAAFPRSAPAFTLRCSSWAA